MTISRQQFNQQCLDFVTKCRQFDEDWYLVSEEQVRLDILSNHKDINRAQPMLLKNELKGIGNNVRTHEYTVLYSDSFEVPVCYFSVSDQNGSPIEPEIFDDTQVLEQPIHQVEHPVLFRPFYMVHPCRTADFMKSQENSFNYLICWLSTIGTLIGLKLDPRFGQSDTLKNELF